MFVRKSIGWFSALVLFPIALAGGCSSGSEISAEQAESGTLELPLVTSVNDHTYRLSGYLYLSGPTSGYFSLNGDAFEISLALSTGQYAAYLYEWSLQRDDGSGNFVPVVARLASSYAVSFRIFDGTKSTIAYEFETDGVVVRVGSGTVAVRVGVTETPAVCTPFGTDCGEGAWCPPSELTGMPRACIAAGAAAAGEPCAGPFDCAADSSCFDFGSGPVCADLCEVGEFGLACSVDSDCVPAGVDYGVCTPVGGDE